MKSKGRTVDVRASFCDNTECVTVAVDEEFVVLGLDKARFLMSQLEVTIDAQEKVRRMREMKARFDIAGTMDGNS